MGVFEGGQRPALGLQPRGVTFGPGAFGGGKAAPVAEQEVREPMTRAQQVGPNVFPTAEQIARRLFLVARDMNRGQRAGAIEHRELPRVTTIGVDAVTGTARDQGRRDHVTGDVMSRQRALQLEAARPGFVATLDRPLAVQALDTAQNRRTVRRQRVERWRPLSGQQDRGHRRRRVLIEGNDGSRLRHDRPPLYCGSARALAGEE